MKFCYSCSTLKEVSNFYRRGDFKKSYRSICKICTKEKIKNQYKNDVNCRNKKAEYFKKNKLKLDEYKKKYVAKNKKKISKHHSEYIKNRKKTDINFKLTCLLRTRLNTALSRSYKSGSAVSDLGCSVEFLKQQLESKFQSGMTWDNYGKGPGQWSIDHKVPMSKFDLTKKEELLIACHYTNLQPMWHRENIIKGAK